jgi:hypothetical protein
MNSKKLLGMTIALAVLAGIAAVQHRGTQKRPPDAAGTGRLLLDGLDLNTVDAMSVTEGTNTVSLIKKEGKWTNASLHGYPVHFEKLANALRRTAEVERGWPVRAYNIDSGELGLDHPKTIRLSSGGREVARIEVGARREGSESAGWSNQYFIRTDGAEAVYLVDYDFHPFEADAEAWMESAILHVRSADIVAVQAGDAELKLDGSAWTLADLDPQTETLDTAAAGKVRAALQYLNARTVADPAASDDALGFAEPSKYAARDKDGFSYTLMVGGEAADEGRYLRVSVDYAPPPAPVAPADEAPQEEQDAYAAALENYTAACEAHRKKAVELNAGWGGWTYVISSADALDLLVSREGLVKRGDSDAAEEEEDVEEKD